MLYEFIIIVLLILNACLGVLLGITLFLLYLAIEAPALLDEVHAVAKRKKGENANPQ